MRPPVRGRGRGSANPSGLLALYRQSPGQLRPHPPRPGMPFPIVSVGLPGASSPPCTRGGRVWDVLSSRWGRNGRDLIFGRPLGGIAQTPFPAS